MLASCWIKGDENSEAEQKHKGENPNVRPNNAKTPVTVFSESTTNTYNCDSGLGPFILYQGLHVNKHCPDGKKIQYMCCRTS